MSKINIRSFSNENEDGAPDLVGITTFSATSYFVPTKGTTAQRPSDHVEVGSLRYNTDTKNLEYYRGKTLGWSQFELIDPDLGGGTGSNTGLGTRVLFGGGYTPSQTNVVDFITVSTLGNAEDFGDMSDVNMSKGSTASRTRAIWAGGNSEPASNVNKIHHVTIASKGDTTEVASILTVARRSTTGVSDGSRAIFAGGRTPTAQNVIDHFSIASLGAASDFGDISRSSTISMGALQSSTRGCWGGGYSPSINSIDYITMSTTGNSQDFGDLLFASGQTTGASNSVRGLYNGDTDINYITIATTGNAQDFGDLNTNSGYPTGAASPTRAVFHIGSAHPSVVNTIEYVQIMSTGNALDFGDLTQGRQMRSGACSNGHGGL